MAVVKSTSPSWRWWRSRRMAGGDARPLRPQEAGALFERRRCDKLKARIKYPDEPEKLADSEIECLKILAGSPELYQDLVALNIVPYIVGLLGHDNIDVSVDVVSLPWTSLARGRPRGRRRARLLPRRRPRGEYCPRAPTPEPRPPAEADREEDAAIHNTFATIENMTEVKPAVAELVYERIN
ncbi:putative Beta-catenin-like protein 1 [Cocos nucifera]|uniref:Putative Beta-catenin-like protein 1 n=1 Tax=Cocos nucifera TaxID=13894 RepID=A0A8K0IJT2_COCNU|nr:putative Beta-catenin-like protein 1 [Cocos nucifera]